MSQVRAGILLDLTNENRLERQPIFETLADPDRGNLEVAERWFSTDPAELASAPSFDLLVFDYGALHHAYGDTKLRWNAAVERWCEDHPGKLALAYSAFTGYIVDELRAELGEVPDNLVLLYERRGVDQDPAAWAKVRAWYG